MKKYYYMQYCDCEPKKVSKKIFMKELEEHSILCNSCLNESLEFFDYYNGNVVINNIEFFTIVK